MRWQPRGGCVRGDARRARAQEARAWEEARDHVARVKADGAAAARASAPARVGAAANGADDTQLGPPRDGVPPEGRRWQTLSAFASPASQCAAGGAGSWQR